MKRCGTAVSHTRDARRVHARRAYTRGGYSRRSGGSASADSRVSRSTGKVGVPQEPAAPVSTVFDLLEESAPPARRSGAHGQPASKVLLVDDEDSLRKVMRDLLERDGYDVTEPATACRRSIRSIASGPTSSCSI